MALKVGELYALFTMDSSGVTSALDGIQSHLTSVGNDFIQAGTLWSNAITVPLKQAFGDAIETGMDFGKAMAAATTKAGIDVNTDEGQAAYQALRDEAFRVARASVYTSEQVAGAYDKMAMAGWRWESMVGGLEPIMDLAAASGEDVVTVSDIVTDAMTAFGMTFEAAGYDIQAFQGDVERFTDVLSAAATSSNTNVGMMGESFKYAGSMAGAMSYSIDDVAIGLGLMANRGIKSGQAGTSIRRVLGNLINPSDKVKEAIDAVGLSLLDGEGNMLGFMDVMLQMREKFSDMSGVLTLTAVNQIEQLTDAFYKTDAAEDYFDSWDKLYAKYGDAAESYMDPEIVEAYDRAFEEFSKTLEGVYAESDATSEQFKQLQYAAEIAGVRGLPALLAIISASEEEFNSLTDAVYGSEGRTHEMKSYMLDNAAGDLEMFKSSVDILKVSIEELVDDQLRTLLQTATEVIDKFIGMDDETKTTILQMAGVAAAIGPALVGIGGLMKMLPALGSAFKFVASPLGLIAVLLGGLALSALDADGKISSAFSEIKDAFGMDGLGIDLSEMLEGIDISGALDSFAESATSLIESDEVQKGIAGIVNMFVGGITKAAENLPSLLSGVLSVGAQIANSIMGSISSALSNSADSGAGIALGKAATDLLHGLLTSITNFGENPDVQGFMRNLGEGFKSAMGMLGDIVGSILGYLFSADGLNAILDAGLSIGGLLLEGIMGVFSGIGNFFTHMLDNMVNADAIFELLPERSQEFASAFKEIAENIHSKNYEYGAGTVAQAVQASVMKAFENGGSLFWKSDLKPYVEDLGDDFWLYIAQQLIDNNHQLDESFLTDYFTSLFTGNYEVGGLTEDEREQILKKYGVETPEEAASVVQDGMEEARDAAAGAAAEVSASIPELMDSSANDFAENGFITQLASGEKPAADAALTVSDAVVQQFLLTMSAENGTAIANAFLGAIQAAINGSAESLMTSASTAAVGAKSAASVALSAISGNNIGVSFSGGIAAGILAGEQAIISAAAQVAASALTASTGTLDIHSPSGRARKEVGLMYGVGLADGILDSMSMVMSASNRVTEALHDQFYLDDMSRGTVFTGRQSVQKTADANRVIMAEERESGYDEQMVQRFAAVMKAAMQEIGIYFDSDYVGHMTSSTVSQDIAKKTERRRPATV